ncbi:MAG: hypothetical protein R3C56_10255 [Pirellulaceae bacterium]
MSVAWSLMATFRDSEERGWKITRRTQIIRAAHAWLQSDAQAMLGPSDEFLFTGNSRGFSATIAPSLDPLPFLERLLSDSSASDEFDRAMQPLEALRGWLQILRHCRERFRPWIVS